MRRAPSMIAQLRALGFDRSRVLPFSGWHVACSQCAAATINGHPCHEYGCPRQVYECKGCGANVARRGTYCRECYS